MTLTHAVGVTVGVTFKLRSRDVRVFLCGEINDCAVCRILFCANGGGGGKTKFPTRGIQAREGVRVGLDSVFSGCDRDADNGAERAAVQLSFSDV